jgi:hypothetical protein
MRKKLTDLTFPRSRIPVGLGLGTRHAPDRARNLNLPKNRIPVKHGRCLGVGRQVLALATLVIREKREALRRPILAKHDAIVQAVKAGDAPAARQAAATHMDNAIVRIQSADPVFWQQEGARLAQPLVSRVQMPQA